MQIFLFLLFCFVGIADSYGQIATNRSGRIILEITKEKRPASVYINVDSSSVYPGIDPSNLSSIKKDLEELILGNKKIKKGVYIVSARYIVMKDNTIADVACEKDPGFGMCDTVLKFLKKNSRWLPATSPGLPIRTYRH